MKKKLIKLTESDIHNMVREAVRNIMGKEHFPASEGHPDIYWSGIQQGNKYKVRYGADYGYKPDSSLLKHGVTNPNAKRTEWMWIQDMVNHAKDLFSEYHLYDQDAYEAIEKLHQLLKQGVSQPEAIDKVGDEFYQEV